MFKRIAIAVTLLALILGGIYFYQVSTKPERIHHAIAQTFAQLGFEQLTLPAAEQSGRQLSYTNIQLDEDGFSSIEGVSVSHSPLLISFSDDDTVANVKGLELTGELSPDGKITIAGFKPPETLALSFNRLPKVINIEDFSMSLLSQDLGGINISGSLQVNNEGDTLKFQGTLDAIQKQVSINAKIEGQYNQNGFVDTVINRTAIF